jgi:lysophospholipase L1-like esterase
VGFRRAHSHDDLVSLKLRQSVLQPRDTTNHRPVQRALKILSISAVSLSLALLGAELLAARTPEANVVSFVPDDELLLVREPSKVGWSWMGGRWVRVRMNAFSMREDELPSPKPAGELRILCLGDSFTYGGGCEQEDAWPQQAQALFAPYDRLDVRVLNGGANGWETRFQRLFAQKHDAALLPDVIVLGWNWNDVVVGDFDAEDAKLFLSGGFGRLLGFDVSGTFVARSKLYRYLHQRFNGSRHVPTAEETHRRFERYTQEMGRLVLEPELEARRRADWLGEDAQVPQAWWIATDTPSFANVREQLRLLAEHGRARGVTVVVALMPEPTWSGPGPYPPRARLAAILDAHGLPWVDLMPDFLVQGEDGATQRNPELWQPLDFSHPSAAGQRVIAERIVRFLRESELLRPRR